MIELRGGGPSCDSCQLGCKDGCKKACQPGNMNGDDHIGEPILSW